jgi:RHS repeat-associated protein
VSYTRDAKGNIQTASMTLAGNSTPLIATASYRPDGLATSRVFGNALTDTRIYDTQGRLRELYLGSADTRLYGYDANGNLTGKQSLPEVGAYSYDALDRLNKEIRTTQAATTTTWTYDGNGNRKTQNTGSYAYLANSNRLTTAPGGAISLDAAGNTVYDGTRSYTYNNAGQLSNVAGAVYAYNSQNLRSRKIVGSQATIYHYDLNGNLIAETNADGQLIRDYLWLDATPIAQIEAGERIAYLHTDHLNTPRLATNDQAQVIWRWEGTAFGETLPNEDVDGDGVKTTINLRFPGQYYDAESGLLYNWNRYYDPKVGRYVTSDPIGLKGGLNTYLYANANANANPLRYNDPTGLLSCTYQISTHTLICENNLGQTMMSPDSVSGNGSCQDKPSCSDKKDVGPLPPGYYMISTPGVFDQSHPPGSPNSSLWLQGPSGIDNPGDRNGIYIHLYGLSKGCIAIHRPYFNVLRNWSINDNGGDLIVIP